MNYCLFHAIAGAYFHAPWGDLKPFLKSSLAFYQISQIYVGFHHFSNTLLRERAQGPFLSGPRQYLLCHDPLPSFNPLHPRTSKNLPHLQNRVSQPRCCSHFGPDNCFRKLPCAWYDVSQHPCPLPSRYQQYPLSQVVTIKTVSGLGQKSWKEVAQGAENHSSWEAPFQISLLLNTLSEL